MVIIVWVEPVLPTPLTSVSREWATSLQAPGQRLGLLVQNFAEHLTQTGKIVGFLEESCQALAT